MRSGAEAPGHPPAGGRAFPWKWVLVILAAATAVAAATTLQSYYALVRMYGPGEVDLLQIAAYSLPDWYIWAALTPIIVRLGRRYPLETGRVRAVAAHAGFGVLFALGELLLSCLLLAAVVGVPERHDTVAQYFLSVVAVWALPMLLVYWVILVAGRAYDYYRKYRETQVQASELRAQLATSQLSALKMQLHPHFLFNTLHSIGVLVRKRDTDRALKMLTGLGDLLRHTLESPRQMITLEEELDFIGRYLEVEQIRFGDRLRVEYDIAPETRVAQVPNLVLQPLVENAIRHGIAPHASSRTLRIEAKRAGGRLRLRVSDDGPGLPEDWRADESRGVGLRNVRQRLRQIYGDGARFEVVRGEPGGAVARVEVPFAREPEEAAPWLAEHTGTKGDEAWTDRHATEPRSGKTPAAGGSAR